MKRDDSEWKQREQTSMIVNPFSPKQVAMQYDIQQGRGGYRVYYGYKAQCEHSAKDRRDVIALGPGVMPSDSVHQV